MAALTRTLCLTVVIAFGASIVSAQTATGGIRGFAKDDTGGVLAGVTVEASSPARIGAAAVEVTDAQGLYGFENLPPGEYTVVYSLQGFTSVRRQGLRVEVGRTIQVDSDKVADHLANGDSLGSCYGGQGFNRPLPATSSH